MIKYLLVLFNIAALFFYNLFFADDVKVTVNSPEVASAGTEFVVELTITKGAISGFAKLQQDLPKGFTAEVVEANGASFTFSNQSVKFIWTQLPDNAEFKISYKVMASDEAIGNKEFEGKFSYVVDNAKLSVNIPKTSILVTEKEEGGTAVVAKADPPKVDEKPKQDTVKKEPEKAPETNTIAASAQAVNCERKIPSEAQENFTVEVTINKGTLEGFAKLQENIPDGLTVTALESAGSSFTFSDQQAKFVWTKLPAQNQIKITYKVTAAKSLVAQKTIEGVFSYLENDETKKSIIAQNSIFINNASSGTEQPVTTEPIKEKEKEKEPITSVTPKIPQPQAAGVNYKVQICALKKRKTPVSYFAETYSIGDDINLENHEGWVKYTLGSFNEYKNARDHRETMRTKGISGPFVTAYSTGKRITVQEALMITSQQWYK